MDEQTCDCGHEWTKHDTFTNAYGERMVLCCKLYMRDGALRFCTCQRDLPNQLLVSDSV